MRELSLNILDIVQNSITAGASLIEIAIREDSRRHIMEIGIYDNGCGMDARQLERVRDPFYTTRTTRKVGMGIPLYRMAAQMSGGRFDIQSQKGEGTRVEATFCTDHVDCIPLGDIASTVSLLISMNTDRDFVYTHSVDGGSFTLDTRQLREILGEVPFSEPEVARWIREYAAQQLETIGGGALSFENIGRIDGNQAKDPAKHDGS